MTNKNTTIGSDGRISTNPEEVGSSFYLKTLEERRAVEKNKFENIKNILVVLSAGGMVFDVNALRLHIKNTYPQAVVFFQTTAGTILSPKTPDHPKDNYDLLIDLTGPRQKQGIFYSKKLKKISRFQVGRNAGFFRKNIYTRIFDEKPIMSQLPKEIFERERIVQKEVLSLAGIALMPASTITADLAKTIAIDS